MAIIPHLSDLHLGSIRRRARAESIGGSSVKPHFVKLQL